MDKMKIEVLEDGTIKTTVEGHVSAANHQNAEDFLRFMARKTGGEETTSKIGHKHTHAHVHDSQKENA